MSAVDAVVKASASSLLFNLGLPEEAAFREAESELLKFIARAGTAPLEIPVNATFNDLVSKIGETVLTETAERAEALLEVLEMPESELKSKLVDLLTVDIIDVIAMIVETFGGDADEVYASFASVHDKEERARKAVSTFARVLLDALRKEHQ